MKCCKCGREMTVADVEEDSRLQRATTDADYDDPKNWKPLCRPCRRDDNDRQRWEDMVAYTSTGS